MFTLAYQFFSFVNGNTENVLQFSKYIANFLVWKTGLTGYFLLPLVRSFLGSLLATRQKVGIEISMGLVLECN